MPGSIPGSPTIFTKTLVIKGFRLRCGQCWRLFDMVRERSIHGWRKAGRYLGAGWGRSVDPRHVPLDLQPRPGPRRLAKGGNASFAKAVRIIVAEVAERDQLIGPLGTDDSHARFLAKQVTIGS